MSTLPPSFPKGLRVLLVDDDASRPVIAAQLRQPELQYTVTEVGSSTEALAYSRAAAASFDVVLAESKLVATDEMTGRAFVDAFEDTPVVLMSEGGDTNDVMRAVTLGAVDFLDKPLSVLKLKNIWQHAVRKMMQRTSLYDSYAGPTKSEPAPMQHAAQPSISNCLPSSMTAPIALVPPAIHKSGSDPALPHRSSIDSPGTPSAGDAEPADAVSAGSVRLPASSFISMLTDDVSMATLCGDGAEEEAGAVATSRGLPRPPLPAKPSSFGPLMPAAPTGALWPQLAQGCVWGTPVGGPLPPPLSQGPPPAWQLPVKVPSPVPPAPQQVVAPLRDGPAPVLLKSRLSSDSVLPSAHLPGTAPDAGTAAAPPPAGFLSVTRSKADNGPLGLKLRKSNSLLDLINTTLATPMVAPTEPHSI